MSSTDKSRLRRVPKRGHYDAPTIYQILDKTANCHIGFVHNDYPVVIPTLFGRTEDVIYLHGSSASRMMKGLAKGIPLCMTVTIVNGLVLAKSLFHSSMNYESVVVFGTGELVDDYDEKLEGLRIVSEQIIPGRWEEARMPSDIEMKATTVIKLIIEEASAKIRTGHPGDDKEDLELDIWSGVVPMVSTFGALIHDPTNKEGLKVPNSVNQLYLK